MGEDSERSGEGSESEGWFDDEAFWAVFGSCMFRPERFEAAATEVPAILALTGVETQAVLDLGCGPGRHAVPMAERGLDVTALDLSSHLLEHGRQYAQQQQAVVEWVRGDMRQFRQEGAYDLVLSMWTSFGYFDDPADDFKVLECCYANLRQGGALIVDIAGKEILVRDVQPVHLTEYHGGDILIERPVIEDGMSRLSNEWLLIQGDRVHRAQWHHNLYSGKELEERLRCAGFDEVALYGGLDGSEYDLEAERLVAVAWK